MTEVCSRVELLLADYALGHLTPDESKVVEDHIDVCPTCSTSLQEYHHVAEGLLQATPPVAPPPRVRSNLIASLAADSTPPARQATWWRSIPVLTLGAAVVTLIALNISLLTQSLQLRGELDALAAQLRSDQQALALVNQATVQRVDLVGDTATGSIVYDPDQQIAIVYLTGLDPLPAEQAYQAWLIAPDGTRTSGGLLQPEPDSAFAILVIDSPQPLRAFAGFGMTIEPSAGSPGPTGTKVVGAEL